VQHIEFTGQVTFHTVDNNLDGYDECLVAEVELEILSAGQYLVLGFLKKEGQLISNRPAYESMVFSSGDVSGETGIYTVDITFSGEQIRQSGEDGPFDLILHAIGEDSNTSLITQTPTYEHTRFGEIGALLKEVTNTAIDENGDGKFEFIESSIEVEVRTPGDYHIQGNLSRGVGDVDVGQRFTLPWGTHILKLRFSIPPMRHVGLIWPFEGVINLIDGTGHTIDGIEFLINHLSIETTRDDIIDQSIKLTLALEKSTFSLEEVNDIHFTARFENNSEDTIILAHPNICLPAEPQEGEVIAIDPSQANLMVWITTPSGNQIVLRNSFFNKFLLDPSHAASTDHLILLPGGSVEVIFHNFHPYSSINPWDFINEPIFRMKGRYSIQMVYKNHYPCALTDETDCVVPWMGEITSNIILVEVE
jgi:hypothetical protein